MGNKPCYCGRGRKYKKCCYWRELREIEEKERLNNEEEKEKLRRRL
jgi:hypothetical protein